jgi:hypothetical protein
VSAFASELERDYDSLLEMIGLLSPPLNQRPSLFLEQKDALRTFVLAMMERQGFKVRSKSPRSFAAAQVDAGLSHIRQRVRAIPIHRVQRPDRRVFDQARKAL